jgi:TolB-like protein/Flp pilus assembly protein TadD
LTDSQNPLSAALADRYLIEHELGRGGMAIVYLAHDVHHDRPVALKVLHPELVATLGPGRFLREIRTTARLQHPHILPVFDSGETGGRLWYTMPFVEGESLREKLRREVQLPIEEAVRITQEVALALDSAHRHGVVHRDIKPENILLADGQALVADFGVARAVEQGTEGRLTETGLAVGTLAYMSPEQAAGERHLDGRSDVYALGCVLYELLTGEPPFTGRTPQAIIAKRVLEPVPHVRTLRDTVPEAIEQALTRALAKIPADRFATAGEFAAALEPAVAAAPASVPPAASALGGGSRRVLLAAVTLLLGLLTGLGVLFAWRRGHSESEAGARFLAVLPFENVGDASEEYFADGITDAVRGKLSTMPGLEVIAGRSSAEYKKSDKGLAQIARELGVTHLVVAKVRWTKAADGTSRVQVSPELVRVTRGGAPTTKWQQSFDAPLTDVFQVQADVAGRVAQELGVVLADSARRELAERPTRNLDAYDLYLRAEAAALGPGRNAPSSLRAAIALYERAIALDSTFALAWARLATATAFLYSNAVPTRDLADKARMAAERALALGPKHAATHAAIGSYYRQVERNNERALESLLRAHQLSPGDVRFLVNLAGVNGSMGRYETALDYLRQADRLDPRSAAITSNMGRILLNLRQYEAADSALRRAQALDPGNPHIIQTRALVRLGRGDLPGAQALLTSAAGEAEARRLAVYLATYNDLYWALDSTRQALVVAARPADFDGDRGSWGLALAQIYAAWGDRPRARAYADSARASFAEQLEAGPRDGEIHAMHALSLAYLGRIGEAVREGERGAALLPVSRNANFGFYVQELLARVYVMAGEPEKAVERLEVLLAGPSIISRDRLRVDPHYAPLRDHPAFTRLLETRP